ncbi:WhiB family transcriptional regulator [Mycolicibacterium mucogenicum]|uniref:Transcriptional regulator WhiB n=1 Tax=Mycolicibacterium mucogenicum DSM 44124 TaxID=1226753 RepID=A0A8H2PF93_MYCMU|nr:WhiB family transcriptional regulator [Mycolicibacterium mucogenicum]KAB7761203.1 transcriptional regulator [Mycolicibacterium mucogenicum DSM 44124]QPG70019.1 WhiB family transcriptional regulator [Mycolicibacterium mucogenicum DSM 44124]
MNIGPTKYTKTRGTRDDQWRQRALCRDHDPDIWFPDPEGIAGHGAARIRAEREAIAIPICEACPVQAECLAWALVNDQRFGVWGGKTEQERETIRRRMQRNARKATA